ncbi:hypothetical protein PR048_017734 [Dryococelus australis]|uniref:Uncharacterized protein n=1 Tax=Dryococelus australis TaxID=614101 RepID=A0ABQ9HAX2_9NEOP|nr:hypothetical protein PR048_017734 [Dryococelus australis]
MTLSWQSACAWLKWRPAATGGHFGSGRKFPDDISREYDVLLRARVYNPTDTQTDLDFSLAAATDSCSTLPNRMMSPEFTISNQLDQASAISFETSCRRGCYNDGRECQLPKDLAASWETGHPRENPPTSGIVRHDSRMQKYRATPPGLEPSSPWWEASSMTTMSPQPRVQRKNGQGSAPRRNLNSQVQPVCSHQPDTCAEFPPASRERETRHKRPSIPRLIRRADISGVQDPRRRDFNRACLTFRGNILPESRELRGYRLATSLKKAARSKKNCVTAGGGVVCPGLCNLALAQAICSRGWVIRGAVIT